MPQLTKKQIKQTEKQIVKQLTQVCHLALAELDGFCWLTHLVDYQNINASMQVVCVFQTEEDINNLEENKQKLINWVEAYLKQINIKLARPARQIQFDSEQACAAHHQGDWDRRLMARH